MLIPAYTDIVIANPRDGRRVVRWKENNDQLKNNNNNNNPDEVPFPSDNEAQVMFWTSGNLDQSYEL